MDDNRPKYILIYLHIVEEPLSNDRENQLHYVGVPAQVHIVLVQLLQGYLPDVLLDVFCAPLGLQLEPYSQPHHPDKHLVVLLRDHLHQFLVVFLAETDAAIGYQGQSQLVCLSEVVRLEELFHLLDQFHTGCLITIDVYSG